MNASRTTFYYLPGYGGRVHTGLGQALLSRGVDLAGRETVGDFRGMRFMDQIETVAEDLQTHFWREDAHVVANSFGAYLFLNAQSLIPPFPGKVLLLSPIVGEFAKPDQLTHFMPPYPTRLMDLVASQFLGVRSPPRLMAFFSARASLALRIVSTPLPVLGGLLTLGSGKISSSS